MSEKFIPGTGCNYEYTCRKLNGGNGSCHEAGVLNHETDNLRSELQDVLALKLNESHCNHPQAKIAREAAQQVLQTHSKQA